MSLIKEKLGIIPIKSLAKSSGFEKRIPKKIGSEAYVESFVNCVLHGDISQASWSRELSKISGELISEQGLQGKVQIRHEAFSQKLLEAALSHTMQINKNHLSCAFLSNFEAIKIHDSTCVKMPIGLIDFLPGSRSRNGINSMARIQLSMNLLNNSYSKIKITSFRKNDQSYSMEIAKSAAKGELHLFDLGYFKKDSLTTIINNEACFLCRYFSVSLFETSEEEDFSNPIDIVKKLKKLDKLGITEWDRQVIMGRKEKIPVRIVACKLSQKVAQAKRRKRIQNRKQDNRKAYKADYLYLMGWNIYFTNVPATILKPKQVFRIYGLRWRIEVIFKAWKSKFDFVKMFAKQYYQLASRAIIQINLILFTIILFLTKWYQHLFHLVQQETGRCLSILKFSAFVKHDLEYLFDLLDNDLPKLIKILAKQYCYSLRKDRLHFVEILYEQKLP